MRWSLPRGRAASTVEGSTTDAIEVVAVTKKYGEKTILNEVSLDIQRGEVVVLVGPSGSGKTTLLRCVGGLEPIQAGSISIFGERVRSAWHMSGQVGVVFQQFNLFPNHTAKQNIVLPLRRVQRLPKQEAEARAVEYLEMVGLAAVVEQRPSQLSGGQQQRVAIARSLAMQPKVMLFDEVTSALDRELVGEVLAVMNKLAREGMTMLVITHELAFAERVADRLVFMSDGQIVEQGAPGDVLHAPQHARTRQFLGQIANAEHPHEGEVS